MVYCQTLRNGIKYKLIFLLIVASNKSRSFFMISKKNHELEKGKWRKISFVKAMEEGKGSDAVPLSWPIITDDGCGEKDTFDLGVANI